MQINTQAKAAGEVASGGWRFKLGLAIIASMVAVWLLIPIAAAMGASAGTIAAITGGILIWNKVLLLLAVAVMGKAGFRELKRATLGHIARLTPNTTVGPLRYRIGLLMFCLPIVSAIIEPYIDAIWPGLRPGSWQFELTGDAMLIASFFVLGGNFWDKLRALFIRTATVTDVGGTKSQV
jgi:hypothetical protein